MTHRLLFAACVVGLVAPMSHAQPQVGPSPVRPAFSPYLNLLRGGNSPGLNYYGLVRPQLESNNNIQKLQQQVADNRTAINSLNSAATAPLAATGHGVTFLNTGSYFSRSPSGGGGGGSHPAARPPGRR